MNLTLKKEALKALENTQIGDIQTFLLQQTGKIEANLLTEIANQWTAKNKAKHKIPSWYEQQNIIFPPPLSVEQASSEKTAALKAEIFQQYFDCTSICDLTGGMGLDTWALSKMAKEMIYIEKNAILVAIASYNFEQLEAKNIQCIHQEAQIYLENPIKKQSFYLDPHRRDQSNHKVFRIEDCEPNLLQIKKFIKNFMVKFSPMLDIHLALEQLENVVAVYVISLENEVKELLFLCSEKPTPLMFTCINLLNDGHRQTFRFNPIDEMNLNIPFAKPQRYLYEANASIMKAGGFKSVAEQYSLKKLAPNSHLYTSEAWVRDFPGRSFECLAATKLDKKELQKYLPEGKANISTRNFPLSPEEIKKKTGLKDGGNYYLFATEDYEKQKIILICSKL